MRIARVAAASAYAHAAPEMDRSECGAALSGLALTARLFPGLTPWAVLFRPLRGSPLPESQPVLGEKPRMQDFTTEPRRLLRRRSLEIGNSSAAPQEVSKS